MESLKNLLLGRTWKGSLIRILIVITVIVVPIRYHYRLVYNSGDSMAPTYINHDILIIQNKRGLSPGWAPSRYDVLVVHAPFDRKYWTKRVIGLSEEVIEVIGGVVYVNGERMLDPHIKEVYPLYIDPIKVPDGHFWVIGDNRETSEYGVFHADNVVGKVVF